MKKVKTPQSIRSKRFKEIFSNKDFGRKNAGHRLGSKIAIIISGITGVFTASTISLISGFLLFAVIDALSQNSGVFPQTWILMLIIYFLTIPLIGLQGLNHWLVALVVFSTLVCTILANSLGINTGGYITGIPFLGFSIILGWLGTLIIGWLLTYISVVCNKAWEYAIVGALLLASLIITFQQFIQEDTLTRIAAIAVIFTGAIVARKALQGDSKFTWIREQVIFWAATGGTSFYGCDLTDACFDGADLPHTDFRKTNLTRASFEGATRLELSRLQGTILEQPKVRKLLTSKLGCDLDYTGANLNGANLKGANLTGAILVEVHALDADFSGATLTGACIQEWNINKHTRFDNVICEKIYLKCSRKNNGNFIFSEPKPDSGTFQPGEFEKWIGEIQNTVDLIFQKGLNWKAFAFSLTQTAIDRNGLDLSRYSIENKGDGVMAVKVGVTPEANKAEIHQGIISNYDSAVQLLDRGSQLFLQAKENQIDELRELLRSQWQEFREFVNIFADNHRNVSIQGEGNRIYILKQAGEIMESKSEGFSVGGNLSIGGDNMTLTGAQVTLGDLTGQVTNTIQELHDVQADDSQELANILTNLQQSITHDAALSENQQQRALKAVNALAKEGKKPPEERDKDIAGMALDALQGISTTVSHASKLAEFAEKYLPTLSKLLGLGI